MSSGITHVGFADESYWNIGRYRSLGLVTASVELVDRLQGDLKRLLDESGVAEFKWKNLDGAKERFAAIKMCKFAIENALARKLRVDVLIWDIQDSRHNVPGRDGITTYFGTCYGRGGQMMQSGGFTPMNTPPWTGRRCKTVSRMRA
jgi:hypothetical protein